MKAKILFVFVLTLTLLAACSSRNQREDTYNASPGETTGNILPPPPPEETPTYTSNEPQTPSYTGGIHPAIDFGGHVLTVAGIDTNSFPFTLWPSAENEPDPATSDNYQRDRLIWNNARRVEHVFNLTIGENRIIPQRLLTTFRGSNMTGEPFADIVKTPGDLIFSAVRYDWLHSLSDINLPSSDLLGAQMYSRIVVEDARGAWAFMSAEPQTSAFTLGINMDIINAVGAPSPIELYNSGRWTWDAWLNIMRLAICDTSGSGRTGRRWGVGGDPGELMRHLIGSNDSNIVNENFELVWDTPNNLEAIEFFHILMREQLWGSDGWHMTGPPVEFDPADMDSYIIMSTGISRAGYTGGMFMDGNSAFVANVDWNIANGNLPFELAIVPMPLGPSNSSGTTWLGGFEDGLVLPTTSVWEPKHVLMIMEEFMSWPGNELNLLTDAPVPWGNTVFLQGVDAVRHVENFRNKRLDFACSVPNLLDRIGANVLNLGFMRAEDLPTQVWVEQYRWSINYMGVEFEESIFD